MSQYCANVVLKVNTKLGGLNHKVASAVDTSKSDRVGDPKLYKGPTDAMGWFVNRPYVIVSRHLAAATLTLYRVHSSYE